MRRRHRLLAAILLALSFSATSLQVAASDVPFAERIDGDNIGRLRVGGVDAIAGVGDWALGNGTICAAVSAGERMSDFSRNGGALIDLGHCGRADDQFSLFQPLVNVGRQNTVAVARIEASRDASGAWLDIHGERVGVRVRTRYAVDLREPERLLVEHRAKRVQEGERMVMFGAIALHPRGSLRAFSIATRSGGESHGFDHPGVDIANVRSMLDSIDTANIQVLVGDELIEPRLSYSVELRSARLRRADGRVEDLPHAVSTGENHTLFVIFARRFLAGSPSPIRLLQLSQLLLMDLRAGDEMVVELAIRVGGEADVASLTDRLYRDDARVTGRVSDPAARIHVATVEGEPVTEIRPAPDGSFSARLPQGRYRLLGRAPGGRSVEREFRTTAGGTELGSIEVEPAARVVLPQGSGPMRLIFVGVDGTPDPRFGDDLLEYKFGGELARTSKRVNYLALGGLDGDPTSVVVAPGRYRVLATRGPEYSVTEALVEARADVEVPLSIAPPQRAFDTPGWIAADLHVHAAPSWDSSLPVDERLRSFLAEAGEVLVATEHNRIHDLGPRIRALGIADRLVSVTGAEVTSTEPSAVSPYTFGHMNVFPLREDETAHRGGAPPAQGQRLREVLATIRADHGAEGPAPVVQLNHPRSRTGELSVGNLFTHLSDRGRGYDPTRPLDAAPNDALLTADPASGLRDLDFDAIEILNDFGVDTYRRVRGDWFSLMLQGVFRTATANSDSHRLSQIVAVPRTYVRLAEDRIPAFNEQRFVQAVREGRAMGTTGPFVELRLGEASVGDTLVGASGTLRVVARAARWVPVSRLRVFVNGAVVDERSIARDQAVEIDLKFDADAFVTVEVEGRPEALFELVAPGLTSLAFTNPIFVDADADGRWSGPGWPETLPLALTDPLALGPTAP